MSRFLHGIIGGIRRSRLKDLQKSIENPGKSRLRYALPDISDVVDVVVVPADVESQIEFTKHNMDTLEASRIEELLEQFYGAPLEASISIVDVPVKKKVRKSKKRKTKKNKETTATS
jgi:hypothetical protein